MFTLSRGTLHFYLVAFWSIVTIYATQNQLNNNETNTPDIETATNADTDCSRAYNDTCLSERNPCVNGTVCELKGTECNIVCVCSRGFTGEQCNTPTAENGKNEIRLKVTTTSSELLHQTDGSKEKPTRKRLNIIQNKRISKSSKNRVNKFKDNAFGRKTYKNEKNQIVRAGLAYKDVPVSFGLRYRHCKGIPRRIFNCGRNGRCIIERRNGFRVPKCKCRRGWRGQTCRHKQSVKIDRIAAHKVGTAISRARSRLHYKSVHPISGQRRDVCNGVDKSSFNCMRRGQCRMVAVNDMMVPSCVCDPGWIGRFCQNRCSRKCLNGGVCRVLTIRVRVCSCVRNFTGRHCERDLRFPNDSPAKTKQSSEKKLPKSASESAVYRAYDGFLSWLFG